MASGALVCTGDVSTSADGAPFCSDAWMLVQVPTPFDPTSLDLAVVLQAFGVGFISIASVLLVIAGARAIIHLVKTG